MTSYLPHSDDVIYIFIDFERLCSEYYHAKFRGNWTTKKENRGGHNVPPAYMVPKDPRLNRVKSLIFFSGAIAESFRENCAVVAKSKYYVYI